VKPVCQIVVVRATMHARAGRRDDRDAKHRQLKEPTYAPSLDGTGPARGVALS
jgi:hypothetical protein